SMSSGDAVRRSNSETHPRRRKNELLEPNGLLLEPSAFGLISPAASISSKAAGVVTWKTRPTRRGRTSLSNWARLSVTSRRIKGRLFDHRTDLMRHQFRHPDLHSTALAGDLLAKFLESVCRFLRALSVAGFRVWIKLERLIERDPHRFVCIED